MPLVRVSASTVLEAPAPVVYALLADYREGHPSVIPGRYFSGLEVERGGVGAGTVIRFRVRALGTQRTVRAAVDEPEPGRVLSETDLETGAVTRFVVEPLVSGRRSAVTIETVWNGPGIAGWVARLLAPPFLRRIYAEELELLGRVAARRYAAEAAA